MRGGKHNIPSTPRLCSNCVSCAISLENETSGMTSVCVVRVCYSTLVAGTQLVQFSTLCVVSAVASASRSVLEQGVFEMSLQREPLTKPAAAGGDTAARMPQPNPSPVYLISSGGGHHHGNNYTSPSMSVLPAPLSLPRSGSMMSLSHNVFTPKRGGGGATPSGATPTLTRTPSLTRPATASTPTAASRAALFPDSHSNSGKSNVSIVARVRPLNASKEVC